MCLFLMKLVTRELCLAKQTNCCMILLLLCVRHTYDIHTGVLHTVSGIWKLKGKHNGARHALRDTAVSRVKYYYSLLCYYNQSSLFWGLQSVQFDANRRGKKMLNSSRDKKEGMYRSGEGAGGPAM